MYWSVLQSWIVQTNDHGDAAKEEFEAAVVGGIDGRSAQAEGSESDGFMNDLQTEFQSRMGLDCLRSQMWWSTEMHRLTY